MSSVAKKGEEVTLECLYTGPDTVTSMVLEVQSQGTWGAVQTNSFVAAVNQYVSILYSNCFDKFLTREVPLRLDSVLFLYLRMRLKFSANFGFLPHVNKTAKPTTTPRLSTSGEKQFSSLVLTADRAVEYRCTAEYGGNTYVKTATLTVVEGSIH